MIESRNPEIKKRFAALKTYLDNLVARFESSDFIVQDPIAIPHGFDQPADREIIGLYAALLAWGQRKTVLNKMEELCKLMHFQPYQFVSNFDEERDAYTLSSFKHRTFQPEDAVSLTSNISLVLKRFGSLEGVFAHFLPDHAAHIEGALQGFSDLLFSIDPSTPARLRKHLARPSTGSACKRLNMYLRWMARPGPVDFGIWTSVQTSQLILPLDVHSGRQARALGMLSRKQDDWKAALELTQNCKKLCNEDPCKYDYAFFGAGAYGVDLDPQFIDSSRINVTEI